MHEASARQYFILFFRHKFEHGLVEALLILLIIIEVREIAASTNELLCLRMLVAEREVHGVHVPVLHDLRHFRVHVKNAELYIVE